MRDGRWIWYRQNMKSDEGGGGGGGVFGRWGGGLLGLGTQRQTMAFSGALWIFL